MTISIIVAVSSNHCIGKDNHLLWHLPVDMVFFKKITSFKTVLMGRKTYESIPEKFRPLPNRKNIVISRSNTTEKHENLYWTDSIQKGIDIARDQESKELCIIGGADIYRQTIAYTDIIYITRVHHHWDGDSFFPEIDFGVFELTNSNFVTKDEKNMYDCTFETYKRKS
jgi:dihydrofolate reductase